MLLAEVIDDRLADEIRDTLMDQLWDELTPDERRALDERDVHFFANLEGIRVPLSPDLFCPVLADPGPRPIPKGPVEGWRTAA